MKTLSFLLCLALTSPAAPGMPSAWSAAPIPGAPRQQAVDLSTPQKTVEAFFAAFNRKDMAAMASCVLDAAATPELTQVNKDFAADAPPNVAVRGVKVYKDETGDEALVTFALQQVGGEEKVQQFVVLRRAGDIWKIVAPPDPEAWATGQSAATNALAYTVRYPKAALEGRKASRNTQSLSNVKQISLGVLMYVQDYDEVYPPTPARYQDAVLPYIKNRGVFSSPLDPAGTMSYKFNPQLAKQPLARIENPATMVVLFEGEYKKLLFRYDGRAIIGFADGRVALVTPEEAKKLRWTP